MAESSQINGDSISNIQKEEDSNAEGATQREHNELLDMVFALESEKQAIIEESRKRLGALRKELEDNLVENEKLKRKVLQLEQSLKQSVMLGGGTDAPKTKQDQEELLLKAKTLLFEKTKVNKQQEQQIATLKTQIEAVKDVAHVTKDMLNLKTAECEHMQTRLEQSQAWIKAEQDKCAITEKKLAISKSVYEKLKTEYDVQSKIFKDLKEAYEQKIKVLTETVEKLKE